jgi:hypothetical protein
MCGTRCESGLLQAGTLPTSMGMRALRSFAGRKRHDHPHLHSNQAAVPGPQYPLRGLSGIQGVVEEESKAQLLDQFYQPFIWFNCLFFY